MLTTTSFDEVRVAATRSGPCPACGRTTRRTRTFTATVSPFNTIIEGGVSRPKTYPEVRRDVAAKAEAWTPDAEDHRHAACHPAADRAPATPTALPAAAVDRDAEIRAAVAELVDTTAARHLPLPAFAVQRRFREVFLLIGSMHPAELILWARALGAGQVTVDASRVHSTGLSVRHEARHGVWRLHAEVTRVPGIPGRLGGTPVEWTRRAGHKTNRGTAAVDGLADGLARLDIAEIIPAVPATAASEGPRS